MLGQFFDYLRLTSRRELQAGETLTNFFFPLRHVRGFMWHSDILFRCILSVNFEPQKGTKRAQSSYPLLCALLCLLWPNSLTLAVAAVPAEITATRMLQLPVAFGADADHVGHDGAGDGFLLRVKLGLLFTDSARRVGQILHTTNSNHNALGDGLLGGGQETLVEPHGVCAGYFIQTVSNFGRVEPAAQHLRRQQTHTATDWTSGKHFLNHL